MLELLTFPYTFMKATQILKELLPPTDYIVPVPVRKKIEEAVLLLELEEAKTKHYEELFKALNHMIDVQRLERHAQDLPPEIRFRKIADMSMSKWRRLVRKNKGVLYKLFER